MPSLFLEENSMFSFQGHDVLVVKKDGRVWLSAVDVCVALQFKNATSALRNHVEDEDKCLIDLGGQRGDTNFVTKQGCYDLAIMSPSKIGKTFRRWLSHDVVPEIEEQGGYISRTADIDQLDLLEKRVADYKALYNSRRVELKKDGNYTEMLVIREGQSPSQIYLAKEAEFSRVNPQIVVIPSGPSQWTIDPDTPLKEAYSSFCTYSRRADKWQWTRTELEEWIHLNWPMP